MPVSTVLERAGRVQDALQLSFDETSICQLRTPWRRPDVPEKLVICEYRRRALEAEATAVAARPRVLRAFTVSNDDEVEVHVPGVTQRWTSSRMASPYWSFHQEA